MMKEAIMPDNVREINPLMRWGGAALLVMVALFIMGFLDGHTTALIKKGAGLTFKSALVYVVAIGLLTGCGFAIFRLVKPALTR